MVRTPVATTRLRLVLVSPSSSATEILVRRCRVLEGLPGIAAVGPRAPVLQGVVETRAALVVDPMGSAGAALAL